MSVRVEMELLLELLILQTADRGGIGSTGTTAIAEERCRSCYSSATLSTTTTKPLVSFTDNHYADRLCRLEREYQPCYVNGTDDATTDHTLILYEGSETDCYHIACKRWKWNYYWNSFSYSYHNR
jgi:hypothetical protein